MLELVEASRQHGCTGYQNDRQGGLHDQQRLAGERRTILRATARSSQRLGWGGPGSQPGGSRAENDSRQQRQPEGEGQDEERRRGADGKEKGAAEGEGKQQTGRSHSHQKAHDAAANSEQDAFHKRLHDDLSGSSADG